MIQRLARHKSYATTMKYLEPLEEDLREGAAEIAHGRDDGEMALPDAEKKNSKGGLA